MKFSDVVNFEPIETVIQIKDSNNENKAREYVKTYVMSERMSESVCDLIIPHIQFEEPMDTKGLMIIGNYGTGKSHLLSVISSIAQYTGINNELKNKNVLEVCKKINGKFLVCRLELGAVKQNLRDLICSELENYMEQNGISFQFPPSDKISNNKQALQEMMMKFQEKFPEKGFLLVIDELLDYLISRDDLELINDLQFLREIGEFCKSSRFRFIAGLQASLFDNPIFQTAADTLRKVKDRFEQIIISKEDIDYVISNRLLNKTQQQKDSIEDHYKKFLLLYPDLQNKIERYVELFPLHPSYTEILQRVTFIEKRHILKSVSQEIKKLLDSEIKEDNPGVISYDSYWKIITLDPSLKTSDDVRKVIDASSVLENKVNDSIESIYKDMAIRIIHALSVHRLTTGGDIHVPVGVTIEELRDGLFLYAKMPENDPEFLGNTIGTVLKKIMQVTDGSFISQNAENLQWYIDVRKDVDYNAKIEKKIESLDAIKKDRYFFEILQKSMEIDDAAYVPDRKIWQWEIEWEKKKVTRNGYLFFGAPNERSTAYPPRDFYLYFIPFFKLPKFQDEKKTDEVFFRFKNIDSTIEDDILFYSAARDLETISSQPTKQIYSQRAEQRLKKVVGWIREQGLSNIQVTYKGINKLIPEVPISKKGQNFSFKEIINSIGSFYLNEHFEQKYSEYPQFEIPITNENKQQYVKEAIKFISNKIPSKISTSVLSSLDLINTNNEIDASNSKYAKVIKNKLQSKGANEVLNRDEIMIKEFEDEFESEFHLENDWLVVILTAMIYSGDLVLGYSGKKISAENISEINNLSYDELLNFKYVQRPSGIPIEELKELSSLLGLAPGLFTSERTLETGVEKLQNKVVMKLETVLDIKSKISNGLRFWNSEIYDQQEQEVLKGKLDKFKEFLDSLQRYDTSAKIKNIRISKEDISQNKEISYEIKKLEVICQIIDELSDLTRYLSQGQLILKPDSSLINSISSDKKAEMISKIKQNTNGDIIEEIKAPLFDLKKSFIEEYYESHKKSRLDSSSQEKLAKSFNSDSLKRLQSLRKIKLLDSSKLINLENESGKLKPCSNLEKSELENEPKCIHCNYTPHDEGIFDAKQILSSLEESIENIENDMIKSLIENLQDPTVKEATNLLEEPKRKIVDKIIKQKTLPEEISDEFIIALNEVLSGLEKAEVNIIELKDSLTKGGMPCTQDELEKRFHEYLEEKTKGKTKSKVRYVLD